MKPFECVAKPRYAINEDALICAGDVFIFVSLGQTGRDLAEEYVALEFLPVRSTSYFRRVNQGGQLYLVEDRFQTP